MPVNFSWHTTSAGEPHFWWHLEVQGVLGYKPSSFQPQGMQSVSVGPKFSYPYTCFWAVV